MSASLHEEQIRRGGEEGEVRTDEQQRACRAARRCAYHHCGDAADVACWRIFRRFPERDYDPPAWSRDVCAFHAIEARKSDASHARSRGDLVSFLYLPIVHPVVGSFEAICVEFILTRFCEIVWSSLHEEQMRAIGAEVAA